MASLVQKAEEFFPKERINPQTNEDTVYYLMSAFQDRLALIHPFYECNGRTSEDRMHILWKRRPDLKHTVRYVSHNGQREGERVEQRMDIINRRAYTLLRIVAQLAFGYTS